MLSNRCSQSEKLNIRYSSNKKRKILYKTALRIN
jgi:hypothetical protein